MSFHEYPYTNFHEMNLDWVVKKVKELAAAWAQVQQDWTDEQAAFANLQSWIENYFNNLDVQTEINVKLDAMVAAGTMSELIAPYVASGLPAEVAEQIGDVVAAQIGPVVAAQISAVVADQLPAVAAAAAAQEVSAWLALHVNPETGYVIDDTFTVQGAAADAKAVGDEFTAIKSALSELEDDLGKNIDDLETTKTDNYGLYLQSNKLYASYDATKRYFSGDIVAGNSYSVKGESSGYEVYFGTALQATVPNDGQIGTINDTNEHTFVAPVGTTKMFVEMLKTNTVTVKDLATLNYSVVETVERNASDIVELKHKQKKSYMEDIPCKGLFPEFASAFWCSNYAPNAFNGKEVVMTVSGDLGDNYLIVSDISPNTITISDVNRWTGFVLTEDEIAYTVYNCKYNSSENKLEIYPPLKKSVSGATLASIFYDSGATYVGLHLTPHGYKSYMYHLYNQNPKHCEIGLYNESFDSREKESGDTIPFQRILPTQTGNLSLAYADVQQNYDYLVNFFTKTLKATFSNQYTPYNLKNGLKWEVDLKGTSGYVEILLGIQANTILLPNDQEVYVDVYIDDTLVSSTTLTDVIGKRICVDYENASKGYIEIYANKFAPINGDSWSICVNKCTWWINEMRYKDSAKMFPTGVFVAQEFDSWGVYHQGVSGTALHNLLNADAGVVVAYENHSKGDQTTAWGTSWWYENVLKYHPTMCITDFLINDHNSEGSQSIPSTIEGPDGTEYNNKISSSDYVTNTSRLISYAINNKIQPLIMRNFQHKYFNFTDAAIEGLSQKYISE